MSTEAIADALNRLANQQRASNLLTMFSSVEARVFREEIGYGGLNDAVSLMNTLNEEIRSIVFSDPEAK